MPLFLTERTLPGITLAQLSTVLQAIVRVSEQSPQWGQPVRYLHSTFIPSESRCLCVFEAASAARVRDVNEAAQVPFARIVEMVQLRHGEHASPEADAGM